MWPLGSITGTEDVVDTEHNFKSDVYGLHLHISTSCSKELEAPLEREKRAIRRRKLSHLFPRRGKYRPLMARPDLHALYY
jgi:hypothetical protein